MFSKTSLLAFTLAEVLITLGIIGVVAAITMPVLIENHKKKEVIVKLQKALSTLNQAYRLSYAENGDIDYEEIQQIGVKQYFDKYWVPYINISEICTSYEMCGYNSIQPFTFLKGTPGYLTLVVTNSRLTFYTGDGFLYIIMVASNNGDVTSADNRIFVDINGSKRPNQFGKDLFTFVKVPEKGIMPYGYDKTLTEINNDCSKGKDGNYCAAKIIRDSWQIKDDYPF